MSTRSQDDRPPNPEDDEELMAQDYDYEDALESEWHEIYDERAQRPSPRVVDGVAGPLDPAA